jgi:hypothetical protein
MTKKIFFNDKYCLTQAVLAGQKTMTRRVLKDNVSLGNWEETKKHLPYKVGEVVAIAQCYKKLYPNADFEMVGNGFMTESAGWNNKMFVRANLMKRHIRITDVKVERLQDISDDDIMREGVWQSYDQKNLFYVSKSIGYALDVAFLSARKAFAYLIDMVSGEGTWNRNPWVVAYSFELVD